MSEYGIITSRSNEQVKLLHKLRQKKVRDDLNLFVVEGKKVLFEALKSKAVIEKAFFSDNLQNSELFRQFENEGLACPLYWVKASVFENITGMKNPEGILAVLQKPDGTKTVKKRIIILEDVQDPNNVGTIIRTADAAGFESVVGTLKTADFYNDKVVRGSMGSIFHLELETSSDILSTVRALKQSGVKIIGTSLDGKNLFEGQANEEPMALILGNESRGMSQALKSECDYLYKIPIYGQAESLNVAIAAGITMYELVKKN